MVTPATVKTLKYTHLELGKDAEIGIAGYYTPQKEERLEYNGRELLYVIGRVVIESWCCGSPGSRTYALVPGYIVNWQNTKNEEGSPVSEVEPILDEEARSNIRKMIETREAISPVEFW
ncbi:hypothetical protein ACFLWW_00395 [Chloroflexota bacterium]